MIFRVLPRPGNGESGYHDEELRTFPSSSFRRTTIVKLSCARIFGFYYLYLNVIKEFNEKNTE